MRALAPLLVILFGCSSGTSPEGGVDGAVSSGSGGGNAGHDSSLQQRSLFLEPGDVTTGHDAAVRIAVRVDSWGLTLAGAVTATLRKYPSEEIVPSSLSEETEDASNPYGGGDHRTWVITPTLPLIDGWYALVVENDGKSVAYQSHQRADGSFENRFRLGSEPLLISIGACASSSDELLPKLLLDFSEPVSVVEPAPIQLSVDGVPTDCTTYDPPSEYGMGLTCTPAPSAAASIQVAIGTGFTSTASGLPLATSAQALPQTFDLQLDGQSIDGCRGWRETSTPVD